MSGGGSPPRRLSVEEILWVYHEGFYPLYFRGDDRLHWVREDIRAFIPIDETTRAKAERVLRRIRARDELTVTFSRDSEAVLAALRDPALRPDTWVQDDVVDVYRTLHGHGRLLTVEAWRDDELVGGVLGIDWPRVIIAETMITREDDASKLCLCELVMRCAEMGYDLIDVQQEHPADHPSRRLGEVTVPFEEFLERFQRAIGG